MYTYPFEFIIAVHIIYYCTGFGYIKRRQQCIRETKITPFMKIVLYDFFMPCNNHLWGRKKNVLFVFHRETASVILNN